MPLINKDPITFDKAARWFFGILIIIAVLLSLHYLKGVLLPFFVALGLAYLINPSIEWIKKTFRLRKKSSAIILGLVGIVAVVVVLSILISPMLAREFENMRYLLEKYASSAGVNPEDPGWIAAIKGYVQSISNNESIASLFKEENLKELLSVLLQDTGNYDSSSGGVLNILTAATLGILYFLFALFEYDRVFNGWTNFVPLRHQSKIKLLMHDFKNAMSNYFRAQSLVALSVGVLFAIGFSLINLPLAIVFGLFIGLLNMVPYLQLAAIVPALFLAAVHSLENDWHIGASIGATLAIFAVVQLIQDIVLVPRFMGEKTGLNAVAILLGLSIWGKLLGFIGLIVAIPFTFLVLTYFQQYIRWSDRKADEQED